MTTATAPNTGVHRTLLALLASALGAIPLLQLISDRGWLIDVWLSMVVVLAPALLIRIRRAPGALQIWPGIVLLIPWLTARFVPQHAWLGLIPSGRTWHDVGNLLTDLHHTTRDGVAPVHSTVAVKLALCTMLALLAALIDLIAVVGRHGALAGVPLLIVFTVSGAVPRKAVHWPLFIFAAIGFLLLLALDARDDLTTWGHRIRRPERSHARPAAAMSGQRIAVFAVLVAVVLPLAAPTKASNLISQLVRGANSKDAGNFGLGAGSINPFVALKGQLTQSRTATLATVHIDSLNAERPFYLRENVLSDYTGTGWAASSHGSEEAFGTFGSSLAGSGTTAHFDATITGTGLSGNPPIFAMPDQITGLGSSARWTTKDQLVVGTTVHGGQVYDESVSQPEPTITELEAAPDEVDAQTAEWLTLPEIPAQVRDLVSTITAGKTGPYERARAISDFFADPANHFTYSLQTSGGDSGSDLVDFLTNRTGFCQQYAAAMGVMLRLARVPARVVLGYTHQPANSAGTFKVTTNDAHAWVEAYFSGVGWIPFDPTPLSGAAGTRATALLWAPHNGVSNPTSTAPSNSATAGKSSSTPGQRNSTSAAPGATSQSSNTPTGSWLIPLVILLVAIVLLLSPWFTRTRRRRQRVRAARSGDPDPLWAELTDTAVDLGYVWSPARSPRQVVRWLRGPVGEANGALRALAQAVEERRYGTSDQAARNRDLASDLDAVTSQLRAGKDRSTRMRARLWPTSLNWAPARWRQRAERKR
jgi:transglutaminase-like putative cysteine protease